MRIRFEDRTLIDLLQCKNPPQGYSVEVLRAFQKAIGIIKNAKDQRDIRAVKSFHLEKMREYRDDRFSIRLKRKWRLFIRFENDVNGNLVAVIDMNNHYGD